MSFIKSLWYVWKVKSYEKAIGKMTKAREKLKAKQAKFTVSYEKYKEKLDNSVKV